MAVQRGPILVADLMADLENRLGDAAPKRGAVLGMAARGRILYDFDSPIGRETIVRPFDPEAMPDRLLPLRRPINDLLEIYKVAI